MAEAKQGRFKTWWTGLKAEFNKIIWLNKATVIKQTVIVIVITTLVGVLISIVDQFCKIGLDQLFKINF